jgi:hypothetical protein
MESGNNIFLCVNGIIPPECGQPIDVGDFTIPSAMAVIIWITSIPGYLIVNGR